MLPAKKKIMGFSLSCSCRDYKSVAVSEIRQQLNSSSDLDSISTNKASTSTRWEDRDRDFSSFSAPSATIIGLLRELDQVEKVVSSVRPIHSSQQVQVLEKGKRLASPASRWCTVAVVKDSDDPLSDFRRSLAQMIVENEIVEVEGLKELVGKYLALNSPEHHPAILRAFTEVGSKFFSQFKM